MLRGPHETLGKDLTEGRIKVKQTGTGANGKSHIDQAIQWTEFAGENRTLSGLGKNYQNAEKIF